MRVPHKIDSFLKSSKCIPAGILKLYYSMPMQQVEINGMPFYTTRKINREYGLDI
jgi:hypothetical protein